MKRILIKLGLHEPFETCEEKSNKCASLATVFAARLLSLILLVHGALNVLWIKQNVILFKYKV